MIAALKFWAAKALFDVLLFLGVVAVILVVVVVKAKVEYWRGRHLRAKKGGA